MKVNGKNYTSIWVEENNKVFIIDQRWLPHEFKIVELKTINDFSNAIKDMWVRGAPLIGVTAAFAFAKTMQFDSSNDMLDQTKSILLSTRPTAVNLHWAVKKMFNFLIQTPIDLRAHEVFKKANQILSDDIYSNHKIGEHGFKIIKDIANTKNTNSINILTHCNAGWLATVDWGTATSPIYFAKEKGIDVHVYVDETRPRNQGAQLTTWELFHNDISHNLIVDNAGGHLMQHKEIDLVIVGSDRTSSTGDVCNKIGTYLKALAAFDNNIPFYVALPSSTIDWNIKDGVKEIPIEERDPKEVNFVQGKDKNNNIIFVDIAPKGTKSRNPAFDVTPSRLISGLITEHGIFDANYNSIKKIKKIVEGNI
ncbi:S-methyl-5-thioribose-1-phosphate isomerase [bacterium]|nr:S-methyl-5-thioribose-1-phosphate isomerase [bacterium]